MLLCVSGMRPTLALTITNYKHIIGSYASALLLWVAACPARPTCTQKVDCKQCIFFILEHWLQIILSLFLSLHFLFLHHPREFGPQLSNKLQHTQLEREKGCKKKKKSPWQRKEEQLQAELAIALRREELALFISEMTSTENILICLRDNMITFA